jgi:hypothetical protein
MVFSSCTGYFFEAPDQTAFDEDTLFEKIENVRRLMNEVYRSMPITLNNSWGDRVYGNSPDCITDLAAGFSGQSGHSCHKFNRAQLTTAWGSATGDRGEYIWQWEPIRYINIILKRIDSVPDGSTDEITQIKGECKLLLAWHYFEMWKRFGGVPIVKERLDDTESQNIPRSTFSETYQFIDGLLDEAIANEQLPARSTGTEFGRVNKAFAYCLKARLKVYSASPIFNTATPYIDAGVNNKLICWGNYDKERWAEAETALTTAIDYCESVGYRIVDGLGSPEENYLAASAALPSAGNTELVMGWQQAMTTDGIRFFMPRGENFGGWHGTVPTHNCVKLYRKADGTEKVWPKTWTTAADNPSEPFEDLEPRFQVSIAHNGSHWLTGAGGYDLQFWNEKGDESYTNGGAEGSNRSNADYSYVTWKFTHGHENVLRVGGTWYILHVNMRLSEMYMMRAEARNEYLSAPDDKVTADIEKVIGRSGMSVPESVKASQAAMRAFIERENAIEFFLEDHRFSDLRRTLRSEDVLNFTAVDFRCEKDLADNTYTYTEKEIEKRSFNRQYYLWPFPQNEMNKRYGLIQNPGWN